MMRRALAMTAAVAAVAATAAAPTLPTSTADCVTPELGAVTGGCAAWQASLPQWPSYHGMTSDTAPFAAGDPVQVSPDGSLVVSARPATEDGGSATDWVTTALDAVSGEHVWSHRHGGADFDVPFDVAHTSTGVTLVTGMTGHPNQPNTLYVNLCLPYEEGRAATTAVATATGEPLWVVTGTPGGTFGMALSPDRSTVYVTGVTGDPDGESERDCDLDLLVQAIDIASGAVQWSQRHDLGFDGSVRGADIAWTPHGLVVVGDMAVRGETADGVVVGIAPEDGHVLWSTAVSASDFAESLRGLALAPDGQTVFVAGRSNTATGSLFTHNETNGTLLLTDSDYIAAAVGTADGTLRWQSTWDSGTPGPDSVLGLAATPDGERLIVAGQATGTNDAELDLATVAFDTATGEVDWVHTVADSGRNLEISGEVAVAPDGTVLVTGQSFTTGLGGNALLVALTADGNERETVRLHLEPSRIEYAEDIHLDPVHDLVVIAGRTADNVGSGTPLDQSGPTGVEALDIWQFPLSRFTG